MHHSLHSPNHPDTLDRLARRRAGAKLGWLLHAGVYLTVQLALAGLALMQGRTWTPYPALGWGLGLLLHGAVVWLALPGAHWREALVAHERAALARERSGHNDSAPQ